MPKQQRPKRDEEMGVLLRTPHSRDFSAVLNELLRVLRRAGHRKHDAHREVVQCGHAALRARTVSCVLLAAEQRDHASLAAQRRDTENAGVHSDCGHAAATDEHRIRHGVAAGLFAVFDL